MTHPAIRANWRDIPFADLGDLEIAAMPEREGRFYGEWLAEQSRDVARHVAVAAGLRAAISITPTCGNCSAWNNGGRSIWGGCWSTDSMEPDAVLDGPLRVTLASERCEAWINPAADMSRVAA